MPKRTYEQVTRILSRGDNSQQLDRYDMNKYHDLIDFEANIDDFFQKNPNYYEKYGKDELNAEKVSEIYYDFTIGKLNLDLQLENSLNLIDKDKQNYLNRRQQIRSSECGGDSKVYEDALDFTLDTSEKEKIADVWNLNKKYFKENVGDPRLQDFDDVFGNIEHELSLYEGKDFKNDYKDKVSSLGEEYYDAIYPIIDFCEKQKEAQNTVDYYQRYTLKGQKRIDEVRENEEKFDEKTQESLEEFKSSENRFRNDYEDAFNNAKQKYSNTKQLCDSYAQKFGGDLEERKEYISKGKQKENLIQVQKMRENLVEKYNNTSLLSRIARWILPNSWSEAGRIQDQIDELDEAMTDYGYEKDYAKQLIEGHIKIEEPEMDENENQISEEKSQDKFISLDNLEQDSKGITNNDVSEQITNDNSKKLNKDLSNDK